MIPIHNEARRLPQALNAVIEVMQDLGESFEIVVVDDASTDESWASLVELARSDSRIRAVRLGTRVRQVRAFCLGIEYSRAPLLLTIDADLETPADSLLTIAQVMRTGVDFVEGVRTRTYGSRRDWPSWLLNGIGRWVTAVPFRDLGSGTTGMHRDIAEALADFNSRHDIQLVRPVMMRAARSPTSIVLPAGGRPRPSRYRTTDLFRFAGEFVIVFGFRLRYGLHLTTAAILATRSPKRRPGLRALALAATGASASWEIARHRAIGRPPPHDTVVLTVTGGAREP